MLRVGMQSRRSSVTGSNLMSSTIFIPLLIVNRGTIFHRYDKSNELEIITRDAGASGLHSNAEHWNEEPFVLFNKNLSHHHFVKFYCLKPDNITHFVSQFLKSMALRLRMGRENNCYEPL